MLGLRGRTLAQYSAAARLTSSFVALTDAATALIGEDDGRHGLRSFAKVWPRRTAETGGWDGYAQASWPSLVPCARLSRVTRSCRARSRVRVPNRTKAGEEQLDRRGLHSSANIPPATPVTCEDLPSARAALALSLRPFLRWPSLRVSAHTVHITYAILRRRRRFPVLFNHDDNAGLATSGGRQGPFH